MRIAIITLPLHTNYGGLLQAYALKTVLQGQGHDVTVVDLIDKMPSPKGFKAIFIYAVRILKRIFSRSSGIEVFREYRYKKELPILSANTARFVEKYINPQMVGSYSDIREDEYDAFVVGSDQVWRPLYFNRIEDAFLAFTHDWHVKRIAYAASFGTDTLEYSLTQLQTCANLLKRFNGVSVRENSAVNHCKEWFDYDDALHVLDPVMLLNVNDYRRISFHESGCMAKGKILTYILDPSFEKQHVVDFISNISGMNVYDSSVYPYKNDKPVENRVVPSLESWLALFSNAEFVITDSFHGCVLSILFHKRFIAVGNNRRGLARLNSLLTMFGLNMRFVHGIDPEDDGDFFLSDIDWDEIDTILDENRSRSLDFIFRTLSL